MPNKLKSLTSLSCYQIKVTLIASIFEKIGETSYLHILPAEQIRQNRIKTIQSSLEIESNGRMSKLW